MQAVYEEVLRAGGYPIMQLTTEGAAGRVLPSSPSDEQLDWVPPTPQWAAENADVRIAIMADANTRALSQRRPGKQARAQKARKPLMETSDAALRPRARYRWALTLFPTQAYAAEAGHVAERVRGLLLQGLPGRPTTIRSPPGSASPTRSTAWPSGSRARRRSTSQAPGTDLKLNVARPHLDPLHRASTTCPTASSSPARSRTRSSGEVAFSFPAVYGGREVAGVRFRFEGGKVVDASAERGEEFLIEMLDTDDGARRLGELGIGTNYGIATGTREILLDEKIGGTVHMAIGMSYPETGGENNSAVHWDMVCDLRQGGSLTVDGEELQRDGTFVV